MKKLIVSIFLIFALLGCTGVNVSVPVNIAADSAFVLALQTHPQYKPAVIIALQETKALLANELTYDQLIIAISTKFGGKYAPFGIILANYLAADKPISQTYLNLLDSYKAGVIKKIDTWIILANSM